MLRFAANITLLYRELPLVERFAAARGDGFTAVEILTPENVELEVLRAAARRAGVDVVLCNAPMGDFLEGGPGLSAVPGRESGFLAAIGQAHRMAVELACPIVHLGPSRMPWNTDKPKCLAVLTANLSTAAQTLAADGITVTIEPMNDIDLPQVCLSSVEEALGVLDAAGEPNTALQLDVYHMARMNQDLPSILEDYIDRIGHIQFADVPGRHEPGSGGLDFDELFALVERLGYPAYLGAEYSPSKTTRESLAWFEAYRCRP